VLPFAGILLSIALFPIFAPGFWHHHFGKITAGWTVLFLLPFTASFGAGSAISLIVHALVAEYIPFIMLLLALYTVSGGILVGAACMVRQGEYHHSGHWHRAGFHHGHHGRSHAADSPFAEGQ
jgi:Na+/H+ antiporter NhaD/arsenite permease-like protein